MREIPLTRGLVALIDDDDYESVMRLAPWCSVQAKPGHVYAKRCLRRRPNGSRPALGMHTYLTGWRIVDHINGDGLDNRMANLREATMAQNNANRRLSSRNTSGFKGVCRYGRQWRASIVHAGRKHHLGTFRDPLPAAHAYDAAAVDLFGEFAWLNFPYGDR